MLQFDPIEINDFVEALRKTDDVTTAEFSEAYQDMAFSLFSKGLRSYIDSFSSHYYLFPDRFNRDIASYIFSVKAYDEATTQNLGELRPKLEQFLQANKPLCARIEKTISKKQKLAPILLKKFHKHFREILLEYYLEAAPRDWTPKNTQDVIEVFKKKFLASVSQSNIEPSLDIFSWHEIQKRMLYSIDEDAKKLNAKKKDLKKYLESFAYIDPSFTTIPDNVLELAEKEWKDALKKIFILDPHYKTNKKLIKQFINDLKKTIFDEKFHTVSDFYSPIIDKFYAKSQIGIIEFIQQCNRNNPLRVDIGYEIRQLITLLSKSLYKQLSHREDLNIPRLKKYLTDHYLKSIEGLFNLSNDELQAKHKILLGTKKRIELAKKLVKKHLAQCDEQIMADIPFKAKSYSPQLEVFFIQSANKIAFQRRDRKAYNDEQYVNDMLEHIIAKISKKIAPDSPDSTIFRELINNSTDSKEIRAEIRSYLYSTYELLIKNVLEELIRARKVPVGPPQTIKVEDLDKTDIDEIRLMTEQQFIDRVIELLSEEMPNTLYEDYKKAYPDEYQTWYNKEIMPRIIKLHGLIKIHTTEPYDDPKAKIEAALKKAIDMHNNAVIGAQTTPDIQPPPDMPVPESPKSKKRP